MKRLKVMLATLSIFMIGCAGSSVSSSVPVSSYTATNVIVPREENTDAPVHVNINSTKLNENDVIISWEPVVDTKGYIVDFGRASYKTDQTSFDLSLDNHDWPNDMVGSEMIEIHVSTVSRNDIVSDPIVASIEVPRASLHFVFQDDNGNVVKEEDCAYTLPASLQTMDLSDESITIGPLQLAEAPDGWKIEAESNTSENKLQSGENIITLTVSKADQTAA